jgi:nucleoside-diphosphate-sugar epimerase
MIGKLMGHKKVHIEIDPTRLRPLDVTRLQCDSRKARRVTGWKPKMDIMEGLKNTILDFEGHGKKWLWETKISDEKDVWKDKKDTRRKIEV